MPTGPKLRTHTQDLSQRKAPGTTAPTIERLTAKCACAVAALPRERLLEPMVMQEERGMQSKAKSAREAKDGEPGDATRIERTDGKLQGEPQNAHACAV